MFLFGFSILHAGYRRRGRRYAQAEQEKIFQDIKTTSQETSRSLEWLFFCRDRIINLKTLAVHRAPVKRAQSRHERQLLVFYMDALLLMAGLKDALTEASGELLGKKTPKNSLMRKVVPLSAERLPLLQPPVC